MSDSAFIDKLKGRSSGVPPTVPGTDFIPSSGKTKKTASAKKPRKTPQQKIAELEAKQAQLAARIKNENAKLRKQTRREDTRRKIIAGALALEHMEQGNDVLFSETMEKLIRNHVKDSDKYLFEDILAQ